MSDRKRPYQKRRRAELEAETRRRITESAVELHGTVGPARASVSAVAERAGVRRSTVYRHFPDEAALFDACSSHWAAENPPPDLEGWTAIRDPDERLAAALPELYAYYRRTEAMIANLLRDEDQVAVVKDRFAAFHGFLAAAREVLLRGRGLRGRARRNVGAAIGHALSFTTWRSLAREQDLDDRAVAALMCRLVAAAKP
jgi:AcrR family transcriptional regulator